jgi:hypothetical protein
VLPPYVAFHGAVVWPEIQSDLTEGRWITDNLDPKFPANYHIDVHHLKPALRRLTPRVVTERTVTLQKHPVTAWLDTSAIEKRGRKTEVEALAGSKRRTYRTFLGWTFQASLCGSVAEALVDTTLDRLRGTHLWKTPGSAPGQVNQVLGRDLPVGGPLDAAGEWPKDPDYVGAGTVPFVVEVKNIRSILYPYDHDVWDLLGKLGTFPEVLPVLVARRIHFTTFRMFKDLGVIGHDLRTQYFSPAIDADEFARVTDALRLRDARQVLGSDPPESLVRFFREIGPATAVSRRERWERAAPIVDAYRDLRLRRPGIDRADLFRDFSAEIDNAGLMETGGWGPRPQEDEGDVDPRDWDEY